MVAEELEQVQAIPVRVGLEPDWVQHRRLAFWEMAEAPVVMPKRFSHLRPAPIATILEHWAHMGLLQRVEVPEAMALLEFL